MRHDPVQTARVFHALSDPTRLTILEALRHGECCVCELTDSLGAGQSRLSFHLRTLKEAGLLRARRAGRWIYYTTEPDVLERVGRLLARLAGPGATAKARRPSAPRRTAQGRARSARPTTKRRT